MPKYNRPPRKSKFASEELIKLLLIRSMANKNNQGYLAETELIGGQSALPTEKPESQEENKEEKKEENKEEKKEKNKEENKEDSTFEPITPFIKSRQQLSAVNETKKEPPALVQQLKEFKGQLESRLIQDYHETELIDLMTIIQEMENISHFGKQVCKNLVTYARENILTASRRYRQEVISQRHGLEYQNSPELLQLKEFIKKHQDHQKYCLLNEFGRVYDEINKNLNEIEQTILRNEFRSNNQILRDFVTNPKTSHNRTSVNQIIHNNQMLLNQQGEKRIGGALIHEFQSLQTKTQNKLAEAFKLIDQTGGGDSTISLNLDQMSPQVRRAKQEYIQAKQQLINKQQELLQVKKTQLDEAAQKLSI